jgi:hypothetical protein
MKTIITSLLVTILVGCGTNDPNPVLIPTANEGGDQTVSDSYLTDYVKHFYGLCVQTTAANRCEENLRKLKSIKFVDGFDDQTDPNGSVAGVCWWTRSSRRVEIKKNIAKTGSMQERGLIFHELGHCLLDLGHANPESKMMMSPYLFDEKTYVTNWDRLQKELFAIVLSFALVNKDSMVDDKEIPIF